MLTSLPFRFLSSSVVLPTLLATSLGLSACSMLGVYTIDLPQGTPITQTQAQQVQIGMSQDQVLYLLGSPALRDSLAPNRWDYIYDYQAGTDGKKAGKADIQNAEQHLIIYFDSSNRVSDIHGVNRLPK